MAGFFFRRPFSSRSGGVKALMVRSLKNFFVAFFSTLLKTYTPGFQNKDWGWQSRGWSGVGQPLHAHIQYEELHYGTRWRQRKRYPMLFRSIINCSNIPSISYCSEYISVFRNSKYTVLGFFRLKTFNAFYWLLLLYCITNAIIINMTYHRYII